MCDGSNLKFFRNLNIGFFTAMHFIGNYSSTEYIINGSELYFNPVTYATYERCYSLLWREWYDRAHHYVDNEDELEQHRKELMIQGRDLSSRSAREDARGVLSSIILSELLPVIDLYLLALHPETLIPADRVILMSWLTECDFSVIIAPESRGRDGKLIHGHKIGCCHLKYGAYIEDQQWVRDVEWCDKKQAFYERDRTYGWWGRV